MNRKASPMRLTGLLVAFVLVLGAWSAASARIHSLTGNVRAQIGNGLPLPIVLVGPPNGGIQAISGATIRQHGVHVPGAISTGGSPAKIVLDPGQLTYPGAALVNIPVWGSNPNVFQVATQLSYSYPITKISFEAGGRTGATVVTFCGKPGSTVTDNGNPGCAGTPVGTGLIKYTATSNQFGGPAQAAVGGGGNVALKGGGALMGATATNTIIAFFNIQPNPTGAGGGPFGYANMTTPTTPNPGAFLGTVTGMGAVIALNVTLGPGTTNKGTSWGGPGTTGMVTASNPSATPPEKFTLTGNDGRNAGIGTGTINLVSGGFSQRTISGPNANRGWVNLTIGPVISKTPVMPLPAVGALVGLLALSGGYVIRKRMRA